MYSPYLTNVSNIYKHEHSVGHACTAPFSHETREKDRGVTRWHRRDTDQCPGSLGRDGDTPSEGTSPRASGTPLNGTAGREVPAVESQSFNSNLIGLPRSLGGVLSTVEGQDGRGLGRTTVRFNVRGVRGWEGEGKPRPRGRAGPRAGLGPPLVGPQGAPPPARRDPAHAQSAAFGVHCKRRGARSVAWRGVASGQRDVVVLRTPRAQRGTPQPVGCLADLSGVPVPLRRYRRYHSAGRRGGGRAIVGPVRPSSPRAVPHRPALARTLRDEERRVPRRVVAWSAM